MIGELLRPFDFEFFRNGLMVATMAGALCGLVGVYVVLSNMSYLGHGMSHAIFGGFADSAVLEATFGARLEVLEHAGMPIVFEHAHDNVIPLRRSAS